MVPKVFNNLLLFLIHPAGNGDKQETEGVEGPDIATAYHYPTLRDRVIGLRHPLRLRGIAQVRCREAAHAWLFPARRVPSLIHLILANFSPSGDKS